MTILLDLNSTLSSNFREVYDSKSYTYDVSKEKYRLWLVNLIKEHNVILITARDDSYEKRTIDFIKAQTGWLPQKWFFKTKQHRFKKAHEWKEIALLSIYGNNIPKDIMALESNAETRKMFNKYGIYAVRVDDEDEYKWSKLPTPVSQQKKEVEQQTTFW